MRFSKRLPRDTATLLQVTVFIIVLLGLSLGSHDPGQPPRQGDLGRRRGVPAGRLPRLGVPYLRSDDPAPAGRCARGGATASRQAAGGTRRTRAAALAGRGSRCVAAGRRRDAPRRSSRTGSSTACAGDRPAAHLPGLRGLVIVAIAGNAVENTAGLVLAWKGRSDLAISVVKNSVAQIAAFLFPLLVLVSFAALDHADVRARARLHRRAGARPRWRSGRSPATARPPSSRAGRWSPST